MSKQVRAEIGCPHCGATFTADLYRSLWVEDVSNRALVEEDRVNVLTCPNCKTSSKLEFPLLCTNVKRKFAIWYEPYPDPQVDIDVMLYRQQFGPDSFYAKAPRVRDWEDFKKKLKDLEVRTDPITVERKASTAPNSGKAGFTLSVTASNQQRYPGRISHLRSAKNRFFYSLIPAAVLLMLVIATSGPMILLEEFLYLFRGALALTVGLFVVLTAVHLTVADFKPWRERGKMFRVYWFGFASWFAFFALLVLLFNPFNYSGGKWWWPGEALHFTGVTVFMPALVGVALYTYERFVR